MLYLIETYWAWGLVAVGCGGVVGHFWLPRLYRQPALAWAVLVLGIGMVVAALGLLPGPAGLYLETLMFLLAACLVGILLGGWLTRSTVMPKSRTGSSRIGAAEAKAAEDARLAAAARAAEDVRRAAEAKTAEDARLAAAAKMAEDARRTAEAQAAEDARLAAAARAAEDARRAAEAQTAEDARLAAAARAAEDARRAAEAQAAVDARLAAAAKTAEDASRTAETKAAEAPHAVAAALPAHPGLQPSGISQPDDGKADNLKLIKGIGPKNEGICHDIGIYHLAQIADWTADEAIWVGHHMAFPGRIEREHWIDQAKLLAAGGDTEHSAGVKAGTIQVDSASDAPLNEAEVAALGASLPAQAASVEGEAAHEGRRPYGLVSPLHGGADDLQRIRGIGPQNERRLHALGIWHFDQIAAWSPENVTWVGSYLAFPGRIDREKWIAQARDLAASRNSPSPQPTKTRKGRK
jgi:predicted flap endonuclease-1-like 5' DNA nuclease